MRDTLTGKTIGKYEILEKLGRGGMAEVYKGYQENLDRYVAIKLMHAFLVAEQDFLNRFQREAKAMAAMNHPNIVGVYDFDLYGDNTYYLVMEYISGGTLKEKLEALVKNNKRLPLEEAVRIAREVSEALAYAHKRNMIHRDIKPANIMMDEETDRAILTDFGIVKLVGGQSMAYTATGALIGTPAYMSPEQALGKSGDERADIYSMGVLLFQMVTSQLPYEADTPLAVVMKHVNEPTPMPVSYFPEIPMALEAIIVKAMAKAPEERYQSAAELATALRTVDLSGAPATVRPTAVPPTIAHDTPIGQTAPAQTISPAVADAEETAAAPPKKRSPWLYVGIIAIVAAIAAGIIFGLGGRETDPTPTIPAIVEASPLPATPTTETPTDEPEETAVPDNTPDVVASAIAAIALTEAAIPTVTETPTKTPTSTQTPTPDATLAFLDNCTQNIELVVAYSYTNKSASSAPVGATFPMNWTLKNSGTCPWPAGLQWTYVEGADWGSDEPVSLEDAVSADEEITLTADFTAPTNAIADDSVWQFVDANGEPFGPPISFSVRSYIPATATPQATDTPVAPPTPEEVSELNYAFEIQACEYVNADWRCRVRLTPYGGGGGPYTLFIFVSPLVELRNQFYYDYYVQARRCSAWNTEIKVIDEATSLEMSRHLYVDPDHYISGGCVEP
ncbi:MAG: protein kinase [Chloroflexi bacterium]|nr:protein kinase [Chloroflexota bacterium]